MRTLKQRFNTMTVAQYQAAIANHRDIANFNPLGLYRSLCENKRLSLEEKITIRDLAHQHFARFFEFLPLKDPVTYIAVSTLGDTLTAADKHHLWQTIRQTQQKYLAKKRLKQRNFGIYGKHECGIAWCPYDGMMVRQGTVLCEYHMTFASDTHSSHAWNVKKKQKQQEKLAKAEIGRYFRS
ncbi:MAG: hypothetical protein Q4C68_01215 [Moraxella sp.]|nr:hypothetical protein [Moraxella sp.]